MNTHVSTHYLIQVPASPSQSATARVGEQLTGLLKSQSGLMLLGCLVVVAVLQLWSAKSAKKGKIATSYWGSGKEKQKAAIIAKKQMLKVTRNNVALYVGTPREMRDSEALRRSAERLENEWRKHGLIKTLSSSRWTKPLQLLNASPTLYVPDAQRGIAAIGAAGSGKT